MTASSPCRSAPVNAIYLLRLLYIPGYLNQAITFSIEDIGGDEADAMVM